ncbi:DUF1836 domain-containing protein [Weissella muntiaci]|uniref:DUF1836 domain-containing protein n=1 Tax=Weissella muntiaci TaxID=2508881 RepID=A0A6C2C4T6_9LACO|nr:DUF1836 domain-containing protein [Weissella muntiaci]TYC48991.1 DUF1836 domain-containing protein [Weissella muntiaci]
MEEYKRWREHLKKITFPSWEDLPVIDLYMDQLVEYVNSVLKPLELPEVTSTMINNYVKKKVLLAPIKKKYQTIHIADLLIISLMKPVFSLEEIRAAIDVITANDYPKSAYDQFVNSLLTRLQGPIDPEELLASELSAQLMRDAASIVYQKMESEKLLALMRNA